MDRLSLFVVVVFAVLSAASRLSAYTRATLYDYDVVCLDLETGKQIWRVTPGPIEYPQFRVVDGRLIAWGYIGRERLGQYALSLKSGARVPMPRRNHSSVPAIHSSMKRNLVDSRGRKFRTDTRGLEYETKHSYQIVRRLEDYPKDLSIVGDVAIFTFAQGYAFETLGGEVYAYDFVKHKLLWEFDAKAHTDEVFPATHTDVFVDGEHVFVGAESTVFKLRLSDGSVLWQSQLPRVGFPPSSAAWSSFFRKDSDLLVTVYDQLFALDAETGRMRWRFDGGRSASLMPTIYKGKVYVGARPVPSFEPMEPYMEKQLGQSALRITRDGAAFSVERIDRRQVPKGAKVWWTLNPPPTRGDLPDLILTLHEFEKLEFNINLDAVLADESSVAFVKHSHWLEKVTLARRAESTSESGLRKSKLKK